MKIQHIKSLKDIENKVFETLLLSNSTQSNYKKQVIRLCIVDGNISSSFVVYHNGNIIIETQNAELAISTYNDIVIDGE